MFIDRFLKSVNFEKISSQEFFHIIFFLYHCIVKLKKLNTMKVSEFKQVCNDSGICTSDIVEKRILDLFFGNRPVSVLADQELTSDFLTIKSLSDRSDCCIIITNTEAVSEEDKKLSPREFVIKHMDEFEIAVQIL